MLRELEYIQDIAGGKFPVAPFAKSSPKEMLAILTYEYFNPKDRGEFVLEWRSFRHYDELKIDSIERVGSSGYTKSYYYLYGERGILKKIVEDPDIPRKFITNGRDINDVYDDKGYLHERVFSKDGKRQVFYYGKDIWAQNTIYFERVDNENDEFNLRRIIETYDEHGKIISQHRYITMLSNPAENFANDTIFFHYEDERLTCVDVCHNGGWSFERWLYSDFDDRGNWHKKKIYRKNKLCTLYEREISYDGPSTVELRKKFELLKAECIKNDWDEEMEKD